MVCTQDIPDEKVRNAFSLLVAETSTDNNVIVGALELLGRHRQRLAGEISREIISYVPKKQISLRCEVRQYSLVKESVRCAIRLPTILIT